jgi:hypothetical protein
VHFLGFFVYFRAQLCFAMCTFCALSVLIMFCKVHFKCTSGFFLCTLKQIRILPCVQKCTRCARALFAPGPLKCIPKSADSDAYHIDSTKLKQSSFWEPYYGLRANIFSTLDAGPSYSIQNPMIDSDCCDKQKPRGFFGSMNQNIFEMS